MVLRGLIYQALALLCPSPNEATTAIVRPAAEALRGQQADAINRDREVGVV